MSRNGPDALALFFALFAKATIEGSQSIASKAEEIIHKEINKGKLREKLDILEYQEDAKNKKSFYTPDEDEENRIVDNIKINDPDFDKELFEKFVQDIFIKFQKAYCDNNLDSMRKFVDVNVLETSRLQAAQNAMLDYKETIDVLSFNYVDFFGYHKEGDLEIVSVAVSIVYHDYIKDSKGEFVLGNDKIKQRGVYILSFARKIGGKTINNIKNLEDGSASVCPNCGADITNSYSQCEHCGTILFNSTQNWLLTHIEQI